MTIETTINDLDALKQKCALLIEDYKTTLDINDLPVQTIADLVHNTIIGELTKNNIEISTDTIENTKPLYGTYYISSVEKTNSIHRSKFIIHKPHLFYFAEFKTKEQLDQFAKTLGFTYKQAAAQPFMGDTTNVYKEYTIDRDIHDNILFSSKTDLPADAKSFKALCNGSIVTCYFTNNGHDINIYRPNPNNRDVYDPLDTNNHNRYVEQHGLY